MAHVSLSIAIQQFYTLAFRGVGLVLVLMVLSHPSSAQQTHFKRIPADAGLSHNTVLTILQDRDGYVWVGTPDGLNRYDGYSFTVYRHDPTDTTSLSDNTVQSLVEGANGDLWIGTANGLNRWDRGAEQFVRYAFGSAEEQNIFALGTDASGAVWVATYINALYRYRPDTESFRRHFQYSPNDGTYFSQADRSRESLPRGIIEALHTDRHGVLWIILRSEDIDERRVYRYDRARNALRLVAQQAHQPLEHAAFYVSREGTLWATPGSLVSMQSGMEPPMEMSAEPARVRFEQQDGTLWYGTETGAIRFDSLDAEPRHYQFGVSGRSALANYVLTMYEDRAGAMWVGTRSGLYRLDPHVKPFEKLAWSENRSPIMAIHASSSENGWVGTLGAGLWRYHRKPDGTYRWQDHKSLAGRTVWAITEDRTGMWLGTDAGLCLWASDQCAVVTLPQKTGGQAVHDLALDAEGYLWVAEDDEVYQVNAQTKDVRLHTFLPDLQGGKTLQAVHVDQVRSGTVWLGTEGAGLVRLLTATHETQFYPFSATDSVGLAGKSVWDIHQDETGALWLGTDRGLVRFDAERNTFTSFYQPDALPGSVVYSILADSAGHLWLGSNQGLLRFHRPTATFRQYAEADGLSDVEFNRRAAFRAVSGRMLFGGLTGVTAFAPDAIHDNPYIPPVVVTSMTVANRTGRRVLKPYAEEPLVLAYNDYALSFAFSALNFTNAQKNRYRYKLEGFDSQWVEAGTSRTAQYTNLAPQSYVFRVQGSNNDGGWNEVGAAIPFRVAPAFWQTTLFQMVVAVLVVLGLAMLYRYRVGHLLAMERLRVRIATDLHDDLGGDLSSIALLSDIVRARDQLTDRDREQLAKVGTSARHMVAALRENVWAINPSNDTLADLVEHMRDTAVSLLSETQVTLETMALQEHQPLGMELRRHLFLIYKEALHNIARHAEATHVKVVLAETEDGFHLHIVDNGIGFDQAAVRRSNGLRHIEQHVTALKGRYRLKSQPGQGTEVEVCIPHKRSWWQMP